MTAETFCEKLELLIDTGSVKNVISYEYYKSLDVQKRPALEKSEIILVAAGGESMNVYGEVNLEVKIAGNIFCIAVVVADLEGMDGLLGIKFLGGEGCSIDVENGILTFKNKQIFMHRNGNSDCYVIRTKFGQVIPSNHECLIKGFVNTEQSPIPYKVGLTATMDSFTQATGLMVAAAVVDTTQPEIHVRCLNLSDKPVTIPSGMVVGLLQPVQNVSAIRNTPSKQLKAEHVITDLPEHLQEMARKGAEYLNTNEQKMLCSLLYENQDVFVGADGAIGHTDLVEHGIITNDAKPIKSRPYRVPFHQREVIDKEVDKMLEDGIIQPSFSPWSSPVVLVTKSDGTTRFCVDYRKLNNVTVKDAYPLPTVNQCLDSLAGSSYFCTLDCAKGYWQVKMKESDVPKTCFTTCHRGNYEFLTMPFGLTGAPATFERLMERALHGLQWSHCLIYLDDVIVFHKSVEMLAGNLQLVFDRIRSAGLKLKSSKCHFFQPSCKFLGHIVSAEGVSCDPEKISAVKDWPRPKSATEIRSFIGTANYYRRFIRSFAEIASPLTNLTRKRVPFVWTEDCELAFESLKEKLTGSSVLAYPSMDRNDMYILDTDASDFGIGAVLSQKQNGQEKVVAYASQKLNCAQRNYCATYRELLAVVTFVKTFRVYLANTKFMVRTDHSALKWLDSFNDVSGLLARWLMTLQSYDFVVEHRPGVKHGNADGLSRQGMVTRRGKCQSMECQDCNKFGSYPVFTRSIARTLEPASKSTTRSNLSLLSEAQPVEKEAKHVTWSGELIKRKVQNNVLAVNEVTNRMLSDSVSSSDDEENNSSMAEESEMVGSESNPEERNPDEPVSPNWLSSYSQEDIQQFQEQDSNLVKLKDWLMNGKSCPSKADLLAENREFRVYCSQWKFLVVQKGVLYRRWTPKCLKQEKLQVILPFKLRKEIFADLHSCRMGGHQGSYRTLLKIRSRFYWPEYKDDVERWVRECRVCQLVRPGPRYRTELHQVPVKNKLDRVALDILGPLKTTRNNNEYLLVVSDYYTRWVMGFPLPDQKGQTIADKLVSEFICIFGSPLYLHSDQGRATESILFQEVCTLLGIKKTRTSPYLPRSDGLVERFNRTILSMMKKFVNEYADDWDDHIPYLTAAYRATPHESTGCSPNLMMFGYENNMPVDCMYGKPQSGNQGLKCPNEYVQWLRGSFSDIYHFADKHLEVSAKRQKQYYDVKSSPITYAVGSFVYRFYPRHSRGKLSPLWKGPYKIVERPSDVHCVIQKSPSEKTVRVHQDSLKPYFGECPTEWQGSGSESSMEEVSSEESGAENSLDCGKESFGRGCRKKRPVERYSP